MRRGGRHDTREMCGTATVFVRFAADVWHCHVSRAEDVGCVALPRFPCAMHYARAPE